MVEVIVACVKEGREAGVCVSIPSTSSSSHPNVSPPGISTVGVLSGMSLSLLPPSSMFSKGVKDSSSLSGFRVPKYPVGDAVGC